MVSNVALETTIGPLEDCFTDGAGNTRRFFDAAKVASKIHKIMESDLILRL
jgi:hypothetical protein